MATLTLSADDICNELFKSDLVNDFINKHAPRKSNGELDSDNYHARYRVMANHHTKKVQFELSIVPMEGK